MSHPAPPGSLVVVRDEQWRVKRVDAFARCAVVTLEGANHRRLRVIDPIDPVRPARRNRIADRPRRDVLRAALTALAAERKPLSLWTAASASIDLLPYQLEPALAVLRGATRILLADAVGLGKTIQAGLILAELRERGWIERALILCPPGLRATWARELHDRFGITSAVIDQPAVAAAAALLPPGINPWSTHGIVIASIDLAKRPEVMAALADLPIDFVIADEAHHLTPGSERGDAVNRLAARAPWCVLVSATPHSGDEAAFGYLTAMGAHHDPIAIFRRSRIDAGLAAARREHVMRIRPSVAEIELFAAVEDYTRAIWRGRGAADPGLQLVAITIARRAASSPLALQRTLRRRLDVLGREVPDPIQGTLPWDEADDDDAGGAPQLLARVGLESETVERSVIEQLLALVDRCDGGAKRRWLARLLRRIKEPAVVFTEYRDTLDALLAALPDHTRVVTICGATPIDLRRAAVDRFNQGGADVMLATDTAGEGLNLHHRCRLVIDVELPWNPMRLEQRIGRVDRLGQRHRVHAMRLFHPGTIEERVLERLELRRQRAESLDHAPVIDERAIAESVFGTGQRLSLTTTTLPRGEAVPGVGDEHARLIKLRSLSTPSARDAGPVGVRSRRRATTAVVAIHAVAHVNELGATVAESVCAHACARPESPAVVAASEALAQAVLGHCAVACEWIAEDLAPLTRAIAARVASIRSRIFEQQSRAVQQSLFESGADRAADRRRAVMAALDAALLRRSLSVSGTVRSADAAPRLVAIWPADPR